MVEELAQMAAIYSTGEGEEEAPAWWRARGVNYSPAPAIEETRAVSSNSRWQRRDAREPKDGLNAPLVPGGITSRD